jgi:hypothetical protein
MITPLYIKKIEILTELIKKEVISLSEALILLEEENLEQDAYEYLLNDSSYWTRDLTNRVIYFDGNVSN